MLERAVTVNAARPREAAAGIERVEVAAVNLPARRSLYLKHEKVYPKLAHGTFRRIKWLALAAMLAIYYVAPWLRWDRGLGFPDQAILIDFPARRFYFFFIEIWPQQVYLVTGLLIVAALVLFLITSLAGRVWCGYACPQTVWTDLFIAVERLIEGDRAARIRLDQGALTASKVAKKAAKHVAWIAIASATGGAWVFYFADAPTLARELAAFEAPTVAYLFVGVFAAATYLLGGFAREQVCTYMCPWPRIQAALQDEHSLIVTYRTDRGEPRGPLRKGESWHGRGHCIDCNNCVAVCPAGIDIRDGHQLQCISCALCIDACNAVMSKIGLPRGLVAYDTLENEVRRAHGEPARYRWLRPRTVLYAGLIAVVGVAMLAALLLRSDLDLTVERDRNPVYVLLSDGMIRNGYTLKAINKTYAKRTLTLALDGLPGAHVAIVGSDVGDTATFTVEPDKLRSVRVYVRAPAGTLAHEATPIRFTVRDAAGSATVSSALQGPKR